MYSALVLHVMTAYSLTRMNWARDKKYESRRDYIAANFASRTMRWTGIIVILFLFFHLADLTWGSANPGFVRGDVYHNMVYSFSRDPVAAIYIVANLALAVHIYHGAWSLFASLGVSNPRIVRFRRVFATAFAGIILAGNISFPVMVQLDVISESAHPSVTYQAPHK
jgi:succinate dehydrogenase / fumarate reductase cytochrome b subunit